MSPLNIAIVGLGNVGTGVARILRNHPDLIARRAGRPINIRRAVVRDLARSRDVSLPEGIVTDRVDDVIRDREIEVAVQLIGGIHPAREIMLALLGAGKHVVTANKALLCEHGPEIFEAARKAERCVAFEASVAGGIPIIATVGQALAGNQILTIDAILNGTSNFILTEMLARQRSYADVLTEAQQLGYAEADPAMDIDGTDAAQKLVLLTQIAYGTRVTLDQFPRRGIDSLELADLLYARELGYKVKLLATSRLAGERLEMIVQPTLVKHDRPLATVDGPFNAVAVEGDAVGRTWYSGRGAGQMPTASAVVADLIDVAVGRAALTFPRLELWGERRPYPIQPAEDISSRFYLRFQVEDRPHVFADIADILGKHQISIASIIQHEAPEFDPRGNEPHPLVPVVVMTHRTRLGQLREADQALSRLSALREPRVQLLVAD